MKDEILKHVVESLYGMHDTQGVSLFNSVILAICLQMARLKRSNEMMEAIRPQVRRDDRVRREDGFLLQPDRRRIVRSSTRRPSRRSASSGTGPSIIVASAKMIEPGFPTMREIHGMPPTEAKEKLVELPGIGDYAADIINPHGGFPIDAWSVDVFGLLFFGKEPEDKREAIEKVKEEGIAGGGASGAGWPSSTSRRTSGTSQRGSASSCGWSETRRPALSSS